MDFVHNPYRCGPLRVGRYALDLSQVLLRLSVVTVCKWIFCSAYSKLRAY